jgi:hypothetical protein
MKLPDYAGIRVYRRSRQTGTMVGLYRSEDAGIDGAPWACVCEDHGTILCVDTRQIAESYVSYPLEWCDACRENQQAQENR